MKSFDKLPRIVMLVLLAICVVVGVLFYAGGSNGTLDVAGDLLSIPRYTDVFLYLNYALVALVCLITLVVMITKFAAKFKYSPAAAVKSLIPNLLAVVVFVVSWFLGSPEKMDIIGYEGTDNQGFWAQCSDMIIYVTYTFLAATILTVFGMAAYNKFKK